MAGYVMEGDDRYYIGTDGREYADEMTAWEYRATPYPPLQVIVVWACLGFGSLAGIVASLVTAGLMLGPAGVAACAMFWAMLGLCLAATFWASE